MGNETVKYNVEWFSNALSGDQDSRILSRIADSFSESQLFAFFNNISTTKKAKFVNYVASGTQGSVFEMETGNVLKIFFSSYNDELEWFESIKTKLVSGENLISEPRIYDYGEFGPLKWVEMEKLVMIQEYVEATNRDFYEFWGVLTDAAHLMEYVHGIYGNRSPEDIQLKQKKLVIAAKEANMTTRELKLVIKFVNDVVNTSDQKDMAFGDFHEGNVGVVYDTIPSGRPRFVYFDR